MTPPEDEDDDRSELANEAKRTVRDVAIDVGGEIVTHVPYLSVPWNLGRALWRRVVLRPRNCNSRSDLYRIGSKMLRSPRRQVTAVSTIRDEEFPSRPCPSVANPHIRDYFIALHSIAYRNLLDNKQVRLLRYADIRDQDKCQEALSLLYHGTQVEIRHSEVPVEFLMADHSSILIGFPSKSAVLCGGFRSYSKRQCRAMSSWIESYGSSPNHPVSTSPTQFAAQAAAVAAQAAAACAQDHDESCLCKVVPVLGDKRPTEECAKAFDRISDWYDGLYENVPDSHYKHLANAIRRELRPAPMTPQFLDVGCGHAFGETELRNSEFKYWGLDASEQMTRGALRHGVDSVYFCDALGALMVEADPRARQFTADAPTQFDVIACQGNTFDFFLGPVQKALALFLFDKRLKEGGLLLFTGHEFSPNTTQVSRVLPSPGVDLSIRYELKWLSQAYCDMKIVGTSGDLGASLLLHPCSRNWLVEFLGHLGYEEIDLGVRWFAPRGGAPYYLWAFRRRSADERAGER